MACTSSPSSSMLATFRIRNEIGEIDDSEMPRLATWLLVGFGHEGRLHRHPHLRGTPAARRRPCSRDFSARVSPEYHVPLRGRADAQTYDGSGCCSPHGRLGRCVVESNGPQEVEAGRNGSCEGLGSVEGSAAGRLSGAGSCEGDYTQPPSGRRRFLAVSKATSGLKCRS